MDQDGLIGNVFFNLIQNNSSEEILDSNGALQVERGGISHILNSAPNLTGKIDDLLKSANQVMNEKNINNIASILESIKDSANKLNKMMNAVQENTKEISSLIENIDKVSITASTMLDTINKKINDGEYDIRDILTPSLMSIENSMNNINKLAKDGSILLQDLKENPYNTIFGYREK